MSGTYISHRKGNFIIDCDFGMNGVVSGMPDRRFRKGSKTWSAPDCASNIQYIKHHLSDAQFSPAALEILNRKPKNESLIRPPFSQDGYVSATEPRDYQGIGLEHIHRLWYFALLMGMGTGKTKMAIDTISADYHNNRIRAVVMFCPLSIRMNWIKEFRIHCPIPVDLHFLDVGTKKGRISFGEFKEKQIGFKWLFVGTESLSAGRASEFALEFAKHHEGSLASGIDESSKIKNHQANRSKEATEIAQYAKRRFIMTGTPVSQGMLDFYSQFLFLDEDIIGYRSYYALRNRYAIVDSYKRIITYRHVDEFIDKVAPYSYQVETEEVLTELKPRQYETRVVKMNPEQAKLYKAVEKGKHEEHGIKVDNVLEAMLRKQQIAGGFLPQVERNPDLATCIKKPYLMRAVPIKGKNPKLEELMNIVDEVGSVPIVIWAVFKDEIKLIVETLKKEFGDQVAEIHGDITEEDRVKANADFQEGRKRFFVGNTATGGMGIELFKSHLTVYWNDTLKYEEREQSEFRTQRMGQTSQCTYINLVAENSIDVTFQKALKAKQDVADYVKGRIKKNMAETIGGLMKEAQTRNGIIPTLD